MAGSIAMWNGVSFISTEHTLLAIYYLNDYIAKRSFVQPRRQGPNALGTVQTQNYKIVPALNNMQYVYRGKQVDRKHGRRAQGNGKMIFLCMK